MQHEGRIERCDFLRFWGAEGRASDQEAAERVLGAARADGFPEIYREETVIECCGTRGRRL